jgi:two-component system, cell cycle sensor histidine kinase and response regulator CckA
MNSVLREKPRPSAKAKLKRKPSQVARRMAPESRPSMVSASPGHAIQQASRMEAMGQLAGGIAHDFNNLLTVILGHSEFLLKRKESPGVSRSRVEEIRKAAERGAWLTNQLLAYSRNQLLEPTVLQINSVVEDMDGMLRCVLGRTLLSN